MGHYSPTLTNPAGLSRKHLLKGPKQGTLRTREGDGPAKVTQHPSFPLGTSVGLVGPCGRSESQ